MCAPFARVVATFCLVAGFASVSSAQSAASPDTDFVVYLRAGGNQPVAPLAQMRHVVDALMHQAGYRVEWRSLEADHGEDAHASLLAVLELSGTCGLAPSDSSGDHTATDATSATSLATTSISDGQVLPFSTLNCAALTRV